MHHGRKLQENKDYLLLERGAATNSAGRIFYTQKVWMIWLIKEEVEAYMCPKCRAFTAPSVRAIIAHWRAHINEKKKKEHRSIRRDAAAFRLLPEKVQKAALRKLDEKERASTDGGADASIQ